MLCCCILFILLAARRRATTTKTLSLSAETEALDAFLQESDLNHWYENPGLEDGSTSQDEEDDAFPIWDSSVTLDGGSTESSNGISEDEGIDITGPVKNLDGDWEAGYSFADYPDGDSFTDDSGATE
jgi:hypothetical protein